MNIKQLIVTSIITLTVTILSGIAVNWYTKKEIEGKETKDNLYYHISNISEFRTDSTKISILSLEILNKNNEKYTNVDLCADFNSNTTVIEVISKNELLEKSNIPTERLKNRVCFKYPVLYPNQTIKVNYTVRNLDTTFKILLQSNEVLGKKLDPQTQENNINWDSQNLKVILLSVLVLIGIFLTVYFARTYLNLNFTSLNNTAFLFLHSKHYDIANKLLKNKIEKNGAGSHELSNFATAEYLIDNDSEKAISILKMSQYITQTRSEKFVLHFNEFIIYSFLKNYLISKEKIDLCNKLDSETLQEYISFSLIIKDLTNNDSTLKGIIDGIKPPNQSA